MSFLPGAAAQAQIAPGIADKVKEKLALPPKYACVLLNDDYTTMEFVIEVLQRFFGKNYDESMAVMLQVHHQGRGVAGVYSYEIAETKAHQVVDHAKKSQFPLQCNVEPLGD